MADSSIGVTHAGGVGDGIVGMLNVFVDPATTAKKVPSKLSWLWPVLILVAVYLLIGYLMLPYALQLGEARLRNAPNMTPETLERARSITHTMTQIITPLTPLFLIGFMALIALLIKVAYQMMSIRPRFRDVFSLLACCSLITMFQSIATYFVLRAKGDPVESQDQLTPPFGLDIFLPGLHGPALAFVGFFSIFEIWFIIVLVFGLAYLTRSSKMQAFFASTPAWLLPLLLRIVGSFFTKPPSA